MSASTPLSIDPPTADYNTIVNPIIQLDEGLEDGPSLGVSLVKGDTVIQGSQVVVNDSQTLQAAFDLHGVDGGMYKIEVTNGCGTVETSTDELFEVACPKLGFNQIDPPKFSRGRRPNSRL